MLVTTIIFNFYLFMKVSILSETNFVYSATFDWFPTNVDVPKKLSLGAYIGVTVVVSGWLLCLLYFFNNQSSRYEGVKVFWIHYFFSKPCVVCTH